MDNDLKVKRFCATPKTILQVSKFMKCKRQWARILVERNCKKVGFAEKANSSNGVGRPGALYKTAGKIPAAEVTP